MSANSHQHQTFSLQAGLSLLEAMVATAVVGVAFAGIYTLTGFSNIHMDRSIAKQKLQMQANQILDVIETDISNIDQYNNMTLTTCTAPGTGVTDKYIVRRYEWCTRMTNELGAAGANDTRTITVTTLADNRKVVHILLESDNGNAQIVMKRTFND